MTLDQQQTSKNPLDQQQTSKNPLVTIFKKNNIQISIGKYPKEK